MHLSILPGHQGNNILVSRMVKFKKKKIVILNISEDVEELK